MDEKMELDRIAKEILIKIGAIKYCGMHEYYWDTFEYDNADLYAIATSEYKKTGGTDFSGFRSSIKSVMDDAGASSDCPACEKLYNS